MNKLLVTLLSLSVMFFAGCASTPIANADGESIQDIQTKLLGDMPMPGGAKINNENTLILGSGDGWAGRVAIIAQQNSNETFTFSVINSKRLAGL